MSFLISLAIKKYNSQFSQALVIENCTISTIPVRRDFDRSYEVSTKKESDFLRLHIHLVFSSIDNIDLYRLEVDGTNYRNALGDEVFVATGSIDSYWRDSGTYKFNSLNYLDPSISAILLEDGSPVYMEDGSYLLTEVGF